MEEQSLWKENQYIKFFCTEIKNLEYRRHNQKEMANYLEQEWNYLKNESASSYFCLTIQNFPNSPPLKYHSA